MTNVTATIRYLRIAPRKVRLVANMVRGMDVLRARAELSFLSNRAARPLEKLLRSAVANARQNLRLDEKDLVVRSITVGGGPVVKRFRARAFGRAATIRRRSSHVTVILGIKNPRP